VQARKTATRVGAPLNADADGDVSDRDLRFRRGEKVSISPKRCHQAASGELADASKGFDVGAPRGPNRARRVPVLLALEEAGKAVLGIEPGPDQSKHEVRRADGLSGRLISG